MTVAVVSENLRAELFEKADRRASCMLSSPLSISLCFLIYWQGKKRLAFLSCFCLFFERVHLNV